MKKILLILLAFTSFASLAQAEFPEGIQLTNPISTTAPYVNVQESYGVVNKINKSDLIEVIEYASAINLPVTGVAGKIYITLDNNRLYRWTGTIYQELTIDVSGKEDISNKQNSLAVDGSNTKYPTVTAVNAGLALKANLASPTFTGAPLAPTANAGNNTTQIASTAFVGSAITTADVGNVKLTGTQTITGSKYFTNQIRVLSDGVSGGYITFIGDFPAVTASVPNIFQKDGKMTFMFTTNDGSKSFAIFDGNSIVGGNKTYTWPNQTGTLALTSNPSSLTAPSFINSTAPATNALLANGTTLANPISGTGTTNYIPKWSGAGTQGNSVAYDTGSRFSVRSNNSNSLVTSSTFSVEKDAEGYGLYVGVSTSGSPYLQGGTADGATTYPLLLSPNGGGVKVGNLSGTGSRVVTADASGNLSANGLIPLRAYTVSSLPAGQPQGTTAFVTDALAPSYLIAVVGGGSVVTPVMYNGTSWVAH